MALSESRRRANEKYNAKAYDEIKVRVLKGRKAELQTYAEQRGESLNGFIGRAISETIQRDTGAPADAQQPAAQAAETPQDGRQLLEVYGYDPLAEKSLAVDIRTQERYIVEPVPVEKPVLSDYDEDDTPF